jgi:uncharacterized protein
VRLLEELYDAFGRGDIPTVLAAMSPDIKWYHTENNPTYPAARPGWDSDAVLNNLFMRLGGGRLHRSSQDTSRRGQGGSIIVEAPCSGSYNATSKRMDAQICHVWDVKDGKLNRFQQSMSTRQSSGTSWDRDSESHHRFHEPTHSS